jgi:hypothetical protein
MTGEGDKTDFNEQNSSQPWPRWLLSFEQVIEAADGVLNLAEVLTCIGDMRCKCPCADTVMPPPRARWISPPARQETIRAQCQWRPAVSVRR